MEVGRALEAAGDVRAVLVVAVARRVEVGEVHALRREHAALDRLAHHRVVGDDLRVLRGVGDVNNRARDELRRRLLRDYLHHEVAPHGEERTGRLGVAVDVVRAELDEDEVHVARLVEEVLDGVDRAAAAVRDEALPADAGVADPLVGHRRAADVGALVVTVSLRDRLVARRRELLHEARAPVAVPAAVRDGVAYGEDVHARLRRAVVEIEPQAAALREVLGPNLRVVAARARRVEHRRQRRIVHVQRAVVPRHQQEASLRVRGVLRVKRDLRARRERGRREKAEGELRRVVGEPTRRAHVERGEVEAAHVVERRRAVHQKAGGAERNRVVADVREGGGRALRHEDRRIGEACRRRPVLLPVADGVKRRIRRARPDVVRDDGAVGRGAVVLHPELDLDGGVGVP